MAKYLAGELSSREQASFMSWVEESPEHQRFFAEMVDVWGAVEEEPLPDFGVNMNTIWEKIDVATDEQSSQNSSKEQFKEQGKVVPLWRKNIFRLAIAASMLLAVGLFIQNYLSPPATTYASVTYQTGAAEQLTVELSDGSQVVLNEKSQFTFNPNELKRVATLTGEAFFDIHRDENRPFEIISGATKTTVLGTSFNVRAYPNEATVEVNVTSGKVAFTEVEPTTRPILLEKGATGIFSKETDEVVKSKVISTNANAWKTKALTFNDESMQQVIPTLERYFKIDLTLSNQQINRCSLNGEFKSPELNELLQIIAFTLNVEVEKRDDGSYVLSGEGCE
ncbi:MAG: FecR family protein [Saprospiraceae bacterium]